VTRWEDLDRAIQDEGGVVPCQNAPDFFFEKDEDRHRTFKIARQLCAECPVKALCASYALDNDEPFGVWGGLSTRERRRMMRRRAA
jgi:WhiB family redox-sensing transcriptional regulator